MKESWDERYRSGKYSSAEPHKLLIALTEKIKAGNALDIACGAGRNAILLAEKGFDVTAVDNSKNGIEIAAQRAQEKGLKIDFRLADLEKDEFEIAENAYDLICDFYYLQRNLFPRLKKALKPEGIFIAAIHIYGKEEKPHRFSLKTGELKEFFKDFEILHYHETAKTDKDTAEHHRRTAEIIAKK